MIGVFSDDSSFSECPQILRRTRLQAEKFYTDDNLTKPRLGCNEKNEVVRRFWRQIEHS